MRIFDFKESLITLPEPAIHLLGVVLGYVSFLSLIKIRTSILIGVVVCALYWAFGHKMYINMLHSSIAVAGNKFIGLLPDGVNVDGYMEE